MGYSAATIENAETLSESLLPGFLASSPPTTVWGNDFFILYGNTRWGSDSGEYITTILAYWFLHNYTIASNANSNGGISSGTYLAESLSVPDLNVVFKHPENLDIFSSYLYQSVWGNKLLLYIRRFYLSNLVSCV